MDKSEACRCDNSFKSCPVSPKLNPVVDGTEGISTNVELEVRDSAMQKGGSSNDDNTEPEMDMDEIMRDAKMLNLPPMPSVEEYLKHKVTHMPFKAWCPICVRNQAQNPPHRKNQHVRTFPSFHIDYMFMNPNVDEEQSNCPMLVIKEKNSGGIWALPVVRKGVNGGDHIASRVAKILVDFGAPKVILKSDQEPAIKMVLDKTARARTAPTRIEEAPVAGFQ